MSQQLPPVAQDKLENLQSFQAKAQQVTMQKHHTEAQLVDYKAALSTLSTTDTKASLYRHIGNLMVETSHNNAENDLNERIESLELRLQAFSKQSDRIQKQSEKLQKELQELLNIP
tara:strand:- start:695 stop:1042 length:348 start_codon:yes stop_codon:yes gene_type:complete